MKAIYNLLQPVDFVIVAIYLAILIGIGIWVSFGQKKNKDQNLFLADKSLGWASIGFTMWGTNVGPSMLVASASAGFLSGLASGNFAWYAFIFILMLAVVFAPRYLGANVSTLPEFLGKRFGENTRNILAWYTLITILISWLSLGLFAGGVLIRQLLGLEMWLSVIVMVVVSTLFVIAGGLKTIAYTSVFQMLLLIAVSLLLVILGISKAGGLHAIYEKTPPHFWNLFQPNSDKSFPWLPILLGYPVMGVWFFCTEQSMVQSVLGAKNLKQGQLGANFIGWLKILDVPLFILPGIICYVLYPHTDANEAYLTMVTNLFPAGLKGLIIVVLVACLISTIGASLNSVSTVFTMDIYVKKYNVQATNREIIRIGRIITVAGAIISVVIALAIDMIKGLDLFNVFQSVLGFLAPPMTVAFLFGVLWKKTTSLAINCVLTIGTAFCLFIGILYLWVYPSKTYTSWPHFMLLSFYLFLVLSAMTFLISVFDKKGALKLQQAALFKSAAKPDKQVWLMWGILVAVMLGLYVVFNGH